MGQTQTIKEAIWLRDLLRQLDRPTSTKPSSPALELPFSTLEHPPHVLSGGHDKTTYALNAIIIHCDNQRAVALAKNPQFHARSKHIDIQWHYQREKVGDSSVDLQYIPTEDQVADSLTKALPKDKFLIFQKALGLE